VNLGDIFPYQEFRAGQEELIQRIYKACIEGKPLVIEAYSGFGKTISIVCGTLSAAEDKGLRVMYACRTKRQVTRVIEELIKVQSKTNVTACYLSAKSDYCLLLQEENVVVPKPLFNNYCNFKTTNNLCYYFLNFYYSQERTGKVIESISSRIVPYPELIKLGSSEKLCPYELQKTILSSSNFVVLTYDYLIDEGSYNLLKDTRYSDKETIIVFDEAHNLADSIFNKDLIELDVSEVKAAAEETKRIGFLDLSEALFNIYERVKTWVETNKEGKQDTIRLLSAICEGKDKLWLHNKIQELISPIQSSWFSLSTGTKIPFETYRCGIFLNKLTSSRKPLLYTSSSRLFLIDLEGGLNFNKYLKRFRSVIFASATLGSPEPFLSELGIEGPLELHSVQTSEHISCLTLIDRSVSTEFKKRNQENYKKIAQKISTILEVAPGNTCVFVTSYSLVKEIALNLHEKIKQRAYFERQDLTAMEAAKMTELYAKESKSVLFGVQGGRFAEGEDFAFSNTSIVIVVGLALLPPTPNLFLRYYWLKNRGINKPYLNVSAIPAFRKAIQAAGRGLRSPLKKTVVILMDKRFDNPQFTKFVPSWLKQDIRSKEWQEDIKHVIVEFFQSP
jgi:DNA excision repair protein ERCC-2